MKRDIILDVTNAECKILMETYLCGKEILPPTPAWIHLESAMEGALKRLSNLYSLYDLGAKIEALSGLCMEHQTIGDSLSCIHRAVDSLEYLLACHVIPLVATQAAATSLLNLLKPLTEAKFKDWPVSIDPAYGKEIQLAIVDFNYALSEEIRQLPAM